MEVLQLDVSGRPQAWISAKEAAILYASDGVAWTLGDAFYVLRGGMQRRTGLQIAHRGAPHHRGARRRPEPGLAPDAGAVATPSCSRVTGRSAPTAATTSTSTS